MSAYRDANAPPPYTDQQGHPVPPYASSYGEKHPSGGTGNPNAPPGSPYHQGPPYDPHGQPQYAPHGQPQYPIPGQPPYPSQGQYNPQGQPQYPPGAGPPHPQQMTYVSLQPTACVTTNPVLLVGPNAIHTVCPMCQATIKSGIHRSTSTKTHLFAILLCLLGCWPCVCIPYCMESCKDTTHTCPSCKAHLGIYRS